VVRHAVGLWLGPHAPAMFVVTEEDEAAIRAVYEQRGEFAARSSCASGFRASPTMRRHGSARAPGRG
jgi:hypothetical protein